MNLFQLWWTGVSHPAKAFDELRSRPAPIWGFWVVLVFNLLISATTLLALYLLHVRPFLESWLTFLPTEEYLLAEIFFLPPLRLLVWLLGAAVVHLGLRLAGHPGEMDTLLNIGGLGYLITMPFILLSDWLLIAVNAYGVAEYTHPLAAVWGLVLTVIGLKRMLNVKTGLAVVLALVSMLVTIPFLAIFAR
jgi:hypothetical protein